MSFPISPNWTTRPRAVKRCSTDTKRIATSITSAITEFPTKRGAAHESLEFQKSYSNFLPAARQDFIGTKFKTSAIGPSRATACPQLPTPTTTTMLMLFMFHRSHRHTNRRHKSLEAGNGRRRLKRQRSHRQPPRLSPRFDQRSARWPTRVRQA